MTDLQPGDLIVVTDPRAGKKLHGEQFKLIRLEDGTAYLSCEGVRRSLRYSRVLSVRKV